MEKQMTLHAGMKLGKLAPKHDIRTAHMIDFVSLMRLPAPPPACDYDVKLPADLGMMANDKIGDCGFAGQGHAIQTWTSQNGHTVTPTTAAVIAAYSGCTGFTPSDPSSDQGVVLLDALNYWRKTGLGGHKIGAFMKVDHHNLDHVKIAINLFGGVYVGVSLPIAAQDQVMWTGPRNHLTGDNAPGSWGGHCVWAPSYDHLGIGLVTWGARKRADWNFWVDYVDEAYVAVSVDWVTGAKPAPNGFNLAKLQSYLALL
jgi:hypothetical protein